MIATAGGLSAPASAALSRLSREGPLRITELARAEQSTQPGMTQLIARMERDGLVRRRACRADGRGVEVEPTEAGLEVFHARRAERVAELYRLLDRLGPEERRAVETALPALSRAIDGSVRGA
ncbi:MarR family winged helix-turn-helix transcriptional regulator [Phaeacidiphilus oryzae]|uniref:MarR family winged helix-turn-helix transcriptional regulator n=1 Tax=Phaeacidiphilus oryzae TaxID=348818 RepID=UPI000AA35D99|nr:MarR family transcriptional regulator [Phaeacidiphilus oryzae]